jgi:type I site-specific restriction-modification system R (restriction) subunit
MDMPKTIKKLTEAEIKNAKPKEKPYKLYDDGGLRLLVRPTGVKVWQYSRTNRILNEKKSHGNIICFRNLKKNTDDAIALFSNPDAKETIFVDPYVLTLLAALHEDADEQTADKQRKAIFDLLNNDIKLRSKKELIEKFINENMPKIKKSEDVAEEFDKFWNEERRKAVEALCREEGLSEEKLCAVIDDYLFTGRKPLRDDVIATLETKPKILERKSIIERVTEKILSFVSVYDDDMGDI